MKLARVVLLKVLLFTFILSKTTNNCLLTPLIQTTLVTMNTHNNFLCRKELYTANLMILLVFSDVVDGIMTFFLALFQSLRVQMGVPLTEQIVQSFMGRFSK